MLAEAWAEGKGEAMATAGISAETESEIADYVKQSVFFHFPTVPHYSPSHGTMAYDLRTINTGLLRSLT